MNRQLSVFEPLREQIRGMLGVSQLPAVRDDSSELMQHIERMGLRLHSTADRVVRYEEEDGRPVVQVSENVRWYK